MTKSVIDLYNEWVVTPHVLNKGVLLKWQDIPYVNKVHLSSTIKRMSSISKTIKSSVYLAELLCHQKPKIVLARKSVAAFKIRKGYAMGWQVTITKSNIGFFFYNLVSNVLSRIKDFEGFFTVDPTSFGCSTVGVLPETDAQLNRFSCNVGMYVKCDFKGNTNKILLKFVLQHLNIPVFTKKK